MRRISFLLFPSYLLTLAAITDLPAQTCEPDPQYADSTGFVFPPPYHPVEEPEGGIQDPACIDNYFEFRWTVQTPQMVLFPISPGVNVEIELEYLKLDTAGAISNLPEGIQYVCQPPDCQFNVDEPGCVLLYGTPTANNVPGEYDLAFTGELKTKLLGTLNVNFPDPNLYPGNYFLQVLEAGNPDCQSAAVSDTERFLSEFRVFPNPSDGPLRLSFMCPHSLSLIWEMTDWTGRKIQTLHLDARAGRNEFLLDVHALPPGMGLYRLIGPEGNVLQAGKLVRHSG
ncbi:MAG: hypothetical protein J5I41_11315 [Saprospiraceae bacterium]|nr:hypothetical protein [Saprospiraceae bacterium]